METRIETDILVVGTGGAGCFAAIKASERGAKVIVVNKVPWLGGCTMIARAGYSAAMGMSDPKDNADIHFQDSVRGGDFVGNQKVLKTMCRENVEATHNLIKWGARFKKRPDGTIDQGIKSSAGHSYPRSMRVAGDFSHIGKTIMDVLQPQMKQRGIEVISNVMIIDLLTSDGEISGAVGLNWRDGTLMVFNTKAVVMATGGLGRLYKYTDNPTYMTGDGYASMYRAGAELVDMEFSDFQFGVYHPSQIFGYPPNCGLWFKSGGMLINNEGERFFKKYLPHRENEGECLRTEISRAAVWEILDGKGTPGGMVYLNCSNVPKEWMMSARGDMVSHFKKAGIDIAWQPMEVAPGLHSFLGGLRIDENAESTTLKGLYAGGEAAGGWGGSNRLGGNAIASALGLGVAAGKSAAERSKGISLPRIDEAQVGAAKKRIRGLLDNEKGVRAEGVKEHVQEVMQQSAWLRRDKEGLTKAINGLMEIEEKHLPKLYIPRGKKIQRYLRLRESLEAINITQCGRIVASAAVTRKESRGSHQRSDYPKMNNRNWLKNSIVWQKRGEMKVRTEPVVVTDVPLPEAKERKR